MSYFYSYHCVCWINTKQQVEDVDRILKSASTMALLKSPFSQWMQISMAYCKQKIEFLLKLLPLWFIVGSFENDRINKFLVHLINCKDSRVKSYIKSCKLETSVQKVFLFSTYKDFSDIYKWKAKFVEYNVYILFF